MSPGHVTLGPVNSPKTIDLVYFNAGGGHRAAAIALEAVCRDTGRPWHVRLVNLFEVLDSGNVFSRVTGMRPEDYYNKRLAYGWTRGIGQELRLLQLMIRLGHRPLVNTLRRHWTATRPDLVVSLVPNFNRALHESVAAALPGTPYMTVLTDMADYPPHFWIEPGQDQYLVCGTPKALEQAQAAGYDKHRVLAASGMILRPDFYRQQAIDPREERRKLGLDPDRLTGLVMFGGHGSKSMLSIARNLPDAQLILVCGHNEGLATRLRALPAKSPRLVLGFTPDIPFLMGLADYFIGKPGPGSVSEAVQMKLPVLVMHNASTLPQERYNSDWVREAGVGGVFDSSRSIAKGVEDITRRLPQLRATLASIENRAVFEIPEFIARVLEEVEVASRARAGGVGDDEGPANYRAGMEVT